MITTLHLGLSYSCNLQCKHCYVDKKIDQLNTDSYKRIIDQLVSKGLMVILYTYGEPLLSDKLFEIAQYANNYQLHQILLSNGWYITPALIERLSKYGINSFNISIDSTNEELHDINRGVRGAFRRAVNAIKLLSKLDKDVGIGVTITNDNLCEIDEFVKLAADLGVNRLSLLAERCNNQISIPISEAYDRVFHNAILGKSNIKSIVFHDPRLIPKIEELYLEGSINIDTYERWINMNSCHVPYSVSLEPNGDLHNCNLCYSLIGNIKHRKIPDFFIGEYYNECFICNTVFSGKN